ncbi:MAG: nucleoside permease [Acidobacteria bacterium]|nr:nucleoside permease [Acidobacteriota bacterium]
MNAGILKFRLGSMMFLQYFIWGAWYVTLSTWLSEGLHLSGQQIGLVAGTTAVGAMVAPFFMGLLADKWVATEKLLALLHITGALLLWTASTETAFLAVYTILLLYCLCYMPTLALTNSLAFRHMRDPQAEFGAVRVLGTLGWIVAGLLVGTLRIEASAVPLRIAAGCSLLMGLYCLTLPSTPALGQTRIPGGSLLRRSLGVLRPRRMAVFALASLLICIPLQFYYAFTNLFLNQTGVAHAASKMTGGQISELACMLLIPVFFRRLGVKYMLSAGMFAWVLRYLCFAYGNPDSRVWMLWAGILAHGICYDFFFVTGQIFIDREAPDALRASAQGLISFLTYGAGMFIGSYVSGAVVQHFTIANSGGLFAWKPIWLFGAAAAAIVLIGFLLVFPADRDSSGKSTSLKQAEEAGIPAL